jgi:hypothetical protein
LIGDVAKAARAHTTHAHRAGPHAAGAHTAHVHRARAHTAQVHRAGAHAAGPHAAHVRYTVKTPVKATKTAPPTHLGQARTENRQNGCQEQKLSHLRISFNRIDCGIFWSTTWLLAFQRHLIGIR